jgi:hypothetical protein
MKKIYTTLVAVFAIIHFSYAQWTNVTGAGNYYLNSGNVGIGTTSPTTALDVVGNIQSNGVIYITKNGDDAIGSGPFFQLGSATGSNHLQGIQLSTSGHLDFWSYDGSSFKQNIRIQNNGSVGIGTTSPGTSLDVKGIIRATTGGLQIGKFGVASNPILAIGIDRIDFSSSAIINGWNNSSNCGISIGTIRNDGVAFSVVTGATLDANYLPSTQGTTAFTVLGNGYVGIGTTTPDTKLAVKGTIHTQEVKVDMTGWNDYVFDKTYQLPTLSSVKTYIDQNHHLPEIPSETEVIKNGVNLGEMVKLQTKKIEELTLYLIDKDNQDKEKDAKLQSQQEQIKQQNTRIAALEKALSKLTDNK